MSSSSSTQRGFFFNVDWLTVLLYLILCAIGWFNIHSAVYDPKHPGFVDFDTEYGKQFIFIMSSVVLAIVVLLLDNRFFITFASVFYIITIILLIAVLVIGRNVGGNQAWIPLGSFRLQPSEFAKVTTVILLARYLSGANIRITEWRSFLSAGAIIGLPMLLIMLQPDTGSTLVFCSLIFVLYREGLSPYFLVTIALMIALFVLTLLFNQLYLVIGVVVLGLLIIWAFKHYRQVMFTVLMGTVISVVFIFSVKYLYLNVLKQHQKERIDILLGLTSDLRKKGYNVNQSKIAIGSGKLWGKGYLQGTQTKYSFVPAQSTDFIFCTVGEEWGFAGSVGLIGIYLILLLRLVVLAERQRSPFSRIYGYGVASVLFFHVIINIGMTVGIVPVIGIPLPFISYGGSSLWSFTMLLFIMIKLDSNRMGTISPN